MNFFNGTWYIFENGRKCWMTLKLTNSLKLKQFKNLQKFFKAPFSLKFKHPITDGNISQMCSTCYRATLIERRSKTFYLIFVRNKDENRYLLSFASRIILVLAFVAITQVEWKNWKRSKFMFIFICGCRNLENIIL